MGDEGRGNFASRPVDRAQRVNAACDRFEAAWGAGPRPGVEGYLAEAPAADRAALLRELLGIELELRRGLGEHPGPEEYYVLFPDLRAAVDDAFDATGFSHAEPPRGRVLETIAARTGPLTRVLLPETVGAGDPPLRPASPEMPPQGDRYQLLGEMARGGMGAILRGHDPDLGRDLAIKVLLEAHRDNPDLVRRFVEEAQIGGQLQHPGIVPVYELGAFSDRRPYFTMKLVRGRTLAALLQDRQGAADVPRFLAIFEAVCLTLAYAHARRVIHRDLKPSNVMVGDFGEVQVMDWGLAKVLPEGGAADDDRAGRESDHEPASLVRTVRSGSADDASQAGSVLGTPAYMPPEQAGGGIDATDRRADVFGLGAILCEVLTGKPPYTGRSGHEVLRKATRGDLAEGLGRLGTCGGDPDLVALAKDCLAIRPDDRPCDAGAVSRRVAAYRTGVQDRLRAAELAGAEARASAAEERKRRRLTVALAAWIVLTVGLGSGGWMHLARQHAARREATSQAIQRDLDRALRLQGQARSMATGDLGILSEAIVAVDKADAVLLAGEPDPAMRSRVAVVREGILADQAAAREQAAMRERDHLLVERLEKTRDRREPLSGVSGRAGIEAYAETDAAYVAGFREAGLDFDALGPTEAGKLIATRSGKVRDVIITALDDWGWVRRHLPGPGAAAAGKRLFAAARVADPDPWRGKLRDAIESKDREALGRLLRDPSMAGQPPASLCLLAQGLYELGDRAWAIQTLRNGQRSYPGDFWLNYQLAITVAGHYLNPGKRITAEQYNEATRFLTAAVAIRPESGSAHAELGYNLMYLGKSNEALAECREGVRLRPDYPNARTHLAWVLQICGKGQEAVAEWREAIRLKPDWAAPHRSLGELLASLGKRDEAITEYTEAARLFRESIRRDPDNANVYDYCLLGAALRELGRHSESLDAYREAVRIDPDFSNAKIGLRNALDRQMTFEEANAALREARRTDPDGPNPGVQFVEGLLLKGLNEEANDGARELARLHPSLPYPHIAIATVLLRKHHVDEAVAESREALRLLPDAKSDRGQLGLALEHLGFLLNGHREYKEATPLLREATRSRPDYPNAHDNLGVAYMGQGRYQEAIHAFREALRLQPNYPGSRLKLITCLSKLSRSDEALAECRQEMELKPDDFTAHFQFGLLLDSQGDWKGAATALRKAKTMAGPETPSAVRIEQSIRGAERKIALSPRLPAVLRGVDRPSDAAELLEFARMASQTMRFSASARLYGEALRDQPTLAEDRTAQHRYNAACSAALAGCGRGRDEPPPDGAARSRLRGQALGWLGAELVTWAKVAETGDAATRSVAAEAMAYWKADAALAGVREPTPLAEIPEAEQKRWQALWAEVDALLDMAGS